MTAYHGPEDIIEDNPEEGGVIDLPVTAECAGCGGTTTVSEPVEVGFTRIDGQTFCPDCVDNTGNQGAL